MIGLILALILIALASIALIAIHADEVDRWIESELEAMESVDRLLEASERARQEMRQVSGRSERSGWRSSGGETR